MNFTGQPAPTSTPSSAGPSSQDGHAQRGRPQAGGTEKKLYAEYRKTKADMQEVTTIKANIDYLLGYSEPGRKKEQER